MIKVYTDGSYRSSEDMGGYGVAVFDGNSLLYAYQEQLPHVTNNQMELMAIKYAFEWIQKYYPDEPVMIYSDSSYCVKAVNEWSHSWAFNGWINSKNEPVKNLDLMKTLYKYFNTNFNVCQLEWNRGHDGVVGNEVADSLATKNLERFSKIIEDYHIDTKNFDFCKKL